VAESALVVLISSSTFFVYSERKREKKEKREKKGKNGKQETTRRLTHTRSVIEAVAPPFSRTQKKEEKKNKREKKKR